VPLIIYVTSGKDDPFVRHHPSKALFALIISQFVWLIMASVKASRGEWWRYPIAIWPVPGEFNRSVQRTSHVALIGALRRFLELLVQEVADQGWAAAEHVAVTEGTVDATHRREVLGRPEGRDRISGLLTGVGAIPVLDQ
jgi:hypothetical protein